MQNVFYMSPLTRAAFNNFKIKILANLKLENEASQMVFLVRLERFFADFYEPLATLYKDHHDFERQLDLIAELLVENYIERATDLKRLDFEREITPDWFQRETQVGGIYYTDLFAGNLQGVRKRLDYIRELGLTYVHLMPLLKPRAGLNDGGYAVEDYRQVNPVLGTMDDLADLATELRADGISLCVDLVVNHTAKEHEWAKKAQAGDPEFLDYYFTFTDRQLPDAYEQTLPEVFPDFAPGNFTFYPTMGRWVWTTFNEYQWDLNYTNPAVFRGMLEYMLFLANKGVDVLRLDAVPFMWKRLGTRCQNQPEVHDLLQAFRALVRIVAPAVIFKAEAIVPPLDLVHYLGTGQHMGKECEIAYNNSLMVLSWSALASRKPALMTQTLLNMPPAPIGTTYISYVRCHDDIGWAITDENANAVGENAALHRRFLNDFYSGKFAGSFARGEVFQYNPRTGDGRMSGMAASLAGLETALERQNPHEVDLAIGRILLLYSIAFSYGGLPLIYMGDEIGLPNDTAYRQDRLKVADNRWMHRPPMDWQQAAQRHDPTSVAGRIFGGMRGLVEARKNTPQLHGAATVKPLWTDNEHVFAYLRQHSSGNLLAICNFSEYAQIVSTKLLREQGLYPSSYDVSHKGKLVIDSSKAKLEIRPYQYLWLTAD